ncbi:MAG: hypothetical protein CMM96_07240 [Rickettsiales bacterium]|nr:hypothetical protein [Rickettsiales bacterium]
MHRDLSLLFFFSLNVCFLVVVSFLTSKKSGKEESIQSNFKSEKNLIVNYETLEITENQKNPQEKTLLKPQQEKKLVATDSNKKTEISDNFDQKNQKLTVLKENNLNKISKSIESASNYIVQYGVFSSNKNLEQTIKNIKYSLKDSFIDLDIKGVKTKQMKFKIISSSMKKNDAERLCKQSKAVNIECYVRKE